MRLCTTMHKLIDPVFALYLLSLSITYGTKAASVSYRASETKGLLKLTFNILLRDILARNLQDNIPLMRRNLLLADMLNKLRQPKLLSVSDTCPITHKSGDTHFIGNLSAFFALG